jgi:hypothetical protein
MDPKAIFEGFDPEEHKKEAEHLWAGTDAYRESALRIGGYSDEDWSRIRAEDDALMKSFAALLAGDGDARGRQAMALAERHRMHIDRWYYPCSPRMHAGLAEMYVSEQRFQAAFDRHGEGMARFVADAIRANARRLGG